VPQLLRRDADMRGPSRRSWIDTIGSTNTIDNMNKQEQYEALLKHFVKYHDRTTLDGDPLLSREVAEEWVVDVQRTREKRLKEIGIV